MGFFTGHGLPCAPSARRLGSVSLRSSPGSSAYCQLSLGSPTKALDPSGLVADHDTAKKSEKQPSRVLGLTAPLKSQLEGISISIAGRAACTLSIPWSMI